MKFNNKFVIGKFTEPGDYKGWFAGKFIKKGDPRRTDKFEVLYRVYKKGRMGISHIHKQKSELNIMIAGQMRFSVNDKKSILSKGMYVFVAPNNEIKTEFLKTSRMITIHSPSIIDKITKDKKPERTLI